MHMESKSIITKLNLQKYREKLILHTPEYVDAFKALSYDTTITRDQYDLIFIFVFSLDEMERHLQQVIDQQLLAKNGYIYFAYPKKNNAMYDQYIDRDAIFPHLRVDEDGYALNSMIKFSRMVSFDEVFTVVGLKLDPKKVKKSESTKARQSVDDYIDHVADIRSYLENDAKILHIYKALTPGYQKDWARYVYSAKRQETRDKRFIEMKDVLAAGYKTMDLYRRQSK